MLLHHAAAASNLATLKSLLGGRADIFARNTAGETFMYVFNLTEVSAPWSLSQYTEFLKILDAGEFADSGK
jgi:hypothetical protein